jgi:hypothetical protein
MLLERSPTPEPTFPRLPDRRYSEPKCALEALSPHVAVVPKVAGRWLPVS